MVDTSLEALESLLDEEKLGADQESLNLLIQHWTKSPRVDVKIESFLRENDSLREAFLDALDIKSKKKSSDLQSHERVVYSAKTEKARSMLKTDLDVDLVLRPKSICDYEEVSYESSGGFLSASTKTMLALGLTAMLVGPFFKMNLTETTYAAIAPKQSWAMMVDDNKYKDPMLNVHIKEVLAELSSKEDSSLDSIAKNILALNLEDVGQEKQVEDENPNLLSIERKATIAKISHLINSYYPYEIKNAEAIATNIFDESQSKDLDYHVLLGIIKTESDFSNQKVSSTGDYSLAQINYKIWSEEFIRLNESKFSLEEKKFLSSIEGKKPVSFSDKEKAEYKKLMAKYNLLDYFKLKESSSYSIEKMAEILQILKGRHGKDKVWYARYHSSTLDLKMGYAQKVKKNIKHMDKVNGEYLQDQILEIRKQLAKAVSSHNVDQEKVQNLNNSLAKFVKVHYMAKN